jgi:hypothetical protein
MFGFEHEAHHNNSPKNVNSVPESLTSRDQRAVCFAARAARRPCPPLDDPRSASQTARSSRACMVQDAAADGFRLRPGGGRCAPASFR